MATTTAPRERQEPPSVGVRVVREALGLTIPKLVERMADLGFTVHPDHVSNVERGWKTPSRAFLIAYAAAVGIETSEIDTEQTRQAKREARAALKRESAA